MLDDLTKQEKTILKALQAYKAFVQGHINRLEIDYGDRTIRTPQSKTLYTEALTLYSKLMIGTEERTRTQNLLKENQ